MEDISGQEKSQHVVDIKAKLETLLSQIPEEDKQERYISLAIQPVILDPNNLIATADLITIDSAGSSIISQTTEPNTDKIFNRTIFLNSPEGTSILEWETDLKPDDFQEIEVEDIFDAIQNLRPASPAELAQYNELLSRSLKDFKVVKSGSYRKTI